MSRRGSRSGRGSGGGPRRIGGAIRAARERSSPPTLLAAAQEAWDGVVGEAIAANAAPVSERNAVLTVSCSSATWAQEIDLLQGELLERLNRELPAPLARIRTTADGARDAP